MASCSGCWLLGVTAALFGCTTFKQQLLLLLLFFCWLLLLLVLLLFCLLLTSKIRVCYLLWGVCFLVSDMNVVVCVSSFVWLAGWSCVCVCVCFHCTCVSVVADNISFPLF